MSFRAFPRTFAFATSILAVAALVRAENGPREIRDNSFLLEEAYNQEDGVIQHIFAFTRDNDTHDWAGSFTEEWPFGGMKHQVSITVPYVHVDTPSDDRLGAILLNYRYQLTGGGEDDRVSVSPRLSLLLPTGDDDDIGASRGGTGLDFNFPVSVRASESLVAHWNAGGTWVANAKDPAGGNGSLQAWKFGTSWIWLAGHSANVMVEASWSSIEDFDGHGDRVWESSFYVNPGVRWAFDFESGLQVVGGVGVPIGVGPSRHEKAVLLYLSLEHAFALAK